MLAMLEKRERKEKIDMEIMWFENMPTSTRGCGGKIHY